MPQEMIVLCCCTCRIYQAVLIKSKRWKCKSCKNTQSIGIVHYYGTISKCCEEAEKLNDEMMKKRNEEAARAACQIGTIEAWGLDCEAKTDNELIKICQCNKQSKLFDGESSKYFFDSDDENSDDKENILTQNSHKRKRSFGNKEKKTRSLPTTQNFTLRQDERRSHSYPQMDDKLKTFGEWEHFLKDGENENDPGDKIEEKHNERTKKNVFSVFGTNLHSSVTKWDTSLSWQENEEDSEDKIKEKPTDSWTEDDSSNDNQTQSEKDFGDYENDNKVASGEIKCSQVDTSSENASPSFRDIKLILSDDLNDDLDINFEF